MDAAARGATGSGGIGAGELVEGEVADAALGKGDGFGKGAGNGAELTALGAGAEIPCALPSSFFHMRHLDVENEFSKSPLSGLGLSCD